MIFQNFLDVQFLEIIGTFLENKLCPEATVTVVPVWKRDISK